jgi:protein TonB
MKTFIIMLFGLILAPTLLAQEDRPDLLPTPLGGMKSIQEKIVYPEVAKFAGIDGKVYVHATIDENGNVASAKIIKGIGAGFNEAALNAIMQTKFTPALKNQKPLKVDVVIPILFKLS